LLLPQPARPTLFPYTTLFRSNPGGKSLENRQRFLRRAKALVQGAVKKTSQDRDIKDVLEGGEVSIPLDGMDEPRFRREGGTRDIDRKSTRLNSSHLVISYAVF